MLKDFEIKQSKESGTDSYYQSLVDTDANHRGTETEKQLKSN